ncbi:MAG TPA: hypothetical protein VF600_02380 [Abditibacteriaceae bacterium]|jgi:hypothetical protein
MGIDPIRFLKEFASRVGHVHGKDTEIINDDLYEYGWEQPATFKENPAFGTTAWRYTIPGQGAPTGLKVSEFYLLTTMRARFASNWRTKITTVLQRVKSAVSSRVLSS